MAGSTSLRLMLVSGTAFAALCALPSAAFAQTTGGDQTTPPAATPTGAAPVAADPADRGDNGKDIIVTGSRIKQDPNNSALPLTIITNKDLSREGISSPEQLISFLANNGNGADNLASNSDVVSGAARGTNGLSAANLRGQGSASTLVLLNGRRVAAHGLQGSAVDVNQIPFAAIDRIEILKDGASAIYGTDAIGGVINFITKTNFTGIDVAGFTDTTQQGDAEIYRLSATVGWGKLDEQGFNVMGSISKSWNGALFGQDRDFVNGNQPNRGLSIDTRGTPIATAFPINPTAATPVAGGPIGITQGGTLLGGTSGGTSLLANPGFFIPGTTAAASGGVNPLRLPGGAGCDSVDGGMNYDSVLWANATTALACSWDTGRAATLQQPLQTLTYYGRATAKFGGNELYVEVTGSDATSNKIFSNNQYSANNTSLPIAYPLNALTAPTYNAVYNSIVAVLPAVAANYGKPIAFRYRCIDCGPREYTTNTKTFRAALGIDGPIAPGWDYRAGASYASSSASSVLGSGYSYRGVFASNAAAIASGTGATLAGQADPRAPTAPGASAPGIVGLFNSGILNPFSLVQTPQALAALDAVSAKGLKLYSGKYETRQFDASISGKLFRLPGGDVQLAVGVDYRRESYSFNGSSAADLNQPDIFNVAFDNVNALSKVTRDVKAAYGEVLFPVFKSFDITVAGRVDDYTGFGSTFNPKVSAKFRPVDWLLLRGSYNTGFRVPSFNQIFNGVTVSPNPGNTLVDPTTCPGGVVNATPGCQPITPDSSSGGNRNLGPETSKQYTFGAVLQPSSHLSLSADYWYIAVDNTIGTITIPQLLANINAFPDRITRTAGIITAVDLRTGNFGSRRTRGVDFSGRGNIEALGGVFSAGFDGTLLIQKKEKLLPNLPYTNTRGVFTLAGDLGLKWKHNVYVAYTTTGGFGLTFSQIYRSGYKNQALPGSPSRPDFNPDVKPYIIYNASISQRINQHFTIAAGVRNVFDTDPPFAITYDSNTGSGSSWEPRVADPRGRSFTVNAEVKF
ncbi:TonB-dependent receptor domain-containing protein [Sphingomonas sp.]|jgi:iron complex outermembrane receptor protein|uniref:TonB-dependent receptor domain-containing protein n=1 Tax=Sphingomonas sp. TaxID=28214 RepID=UPI002E32D905|nr:TonB-dependent receptor [Sphingomonas sp.]HEX4694559.1 TonB-dependent receptor [Sphingomonas sp.]